MPRWCAEVYEELVRRLIFLHNMLHAYTQPTLASTLLSTRASSRLLTHSIYFQSTCSRLKLGVIVAKVSHWHGIGGIMAATVCCFNRTNDLLNSIHDD